ncbi:MAG: hypothetical protein ACSHWY_00385 [Octadecabacter sp.]
MSRQRNFIPVFQQPPLTVWQKCSRVMRVILVAVILLAFGVGLGTLGYHFIVGLPWIDAFLNASMVLAGEGPIIDVTGSGAKIFVSLYSIISGLIFVGVAVIMVTPILKRTLHMFHFDDVIEEVFDPDQTPDTGSSRSISQSISKNTSKTRYRT